MLSMTKKTSGSIWKRGGFSPYYSQNCSMSDSALYDSDDALEFSDLPLTDEGVFGSGL